MIDNRAGGFQVCLSLFSFPLVQEFPRNFWDSVIAPENSSEFLGSSVILP